MIDWSVEMWYMLWYFLNIWASIVLFQMSKHILRKSETLNMTSDIILQKFIGLLLSVIIGFVNVTLLFMRMDSWGVY